MFTPDPANAANPPLIFYVHADHLDTPRVVVDRSDNLRWRWMAEPFGTTAPENNPQGLGVFTQNLRFPGQYADQESGLSYNWHRDYDSSIARYTTPDPLGLDAGSASLYSYVENQPTKYTDPDGLQIAILAPAPAMSLAPWAAPAVAIGLAGYGGWQAGTALYPYIERPLGDAIDWCFASPNREQKCWTAYQAQIRICKMAPTPSARKQCYARAADFYADCLRGKN